MRRQAEAFPLPPRFGGELQSPTLPLPPPRDDHQLVRFLDELAAVPVEKSAQLYAMFDAFVEREAIARVFNQALGQRPVGDVGRFMMLISASGALAHDSTMEPLERLVWTDDGELLHPEDVAPRTETGCCMFAPEGMIQARAAEMFAWIAKRRADDRLLHMVAEHPSVVVRLASADAFLYGHDDVDQAKQRVRDIAREEDRAAIGVPRFTRHCDRAAFDRAVEAAAVVADRLPKERGIPSRMRRRETY